MKRRYNNLINDPTIIIVLHLVCSFAICYLKKMWVHLEIKLMHITRRQLLFSSRKAIDIMNKTFKESIEVPTG